MIKYRGLTKRQYKRRYGSDTPGTSKGENCQAKPIDKAMAKYNRAYRSMPDEYERHNKKKARVTKNTASIFYYIE